jgi:GH15 family glucan-1,4-alpha-glucosidase
MKPTFDTNRSHRRPSLRQIAYPFLAFLVWKATRFGIRLFRQPRLPTLAPRVAPRPEVDALSQSATIAAANLRDRIETRTLEEGKAKRVLCAGWRNFREPWARDLSFALYGLMEAGEWQAARESLEVFFQYQNAAGQFPIKVHSNGVFNRYLHSLFRRQQPTYAPLKPKYISGHKTISLDSHALLVIAALHFCKRSDDQEFLKTHWTALQRAMTWLQGHAGTETALLHQDAFSDWADSVGRTGRILYTNVIYWKALYEMAGAGKAAGHIEEAANYQAQAEALASAIDVHFWRPDLGYYVTSQEHDNLSSSGNLLAIAWGLASPDQAQIILNKMDQLGMADPVPTQVVHRAYEPRFIALENRLGGIGHYHTEAAWLWLGAWHVIALIRAGRPAEAEVLLQRIARVIIQDNVVHEVYGKDRRPLKSFWYASDAPLSWSAGMVVYAHQVYRDRATSRATSSTGRG